MELSTMILFLVFVLGSFLLGVSFTHLFCDGVRMARYHPVYFAVFLILFVVSILVIITIDISSHIEAAGTGHMLAFGMIFLFSTISGFSVMLPDVLTNLQIYEQMKN